MLLLLLAACFPELPVFDCGTAGKPQLDHELLGADILYEHAPGDTEVFMDSAAYDAFREALRPDLPDVDFSEHHVLVASVRVEDACDVRLGGYALVEEAPGFAHLGLEVESVRETCDVVCEGPTWYTVVFTVPAGYGGSSCSTVVETCG